ncbi:hypothetical protein CMI37_14380 [Candidatus Pacearchaeota archaeon]|nr:hypothetical protein [Candidatus Pacearchaeota archaeon]
MICIMCGKDGAFKCPRCRKPLCEVHGVLRLPSPFGPGFIPERECLAPRYDESTRR